MATHEKHIIPPASSADADATHPNDDVSWQAFRQRLDEELRVLEELVTQGRSADAAELYLRAAAHAPPEEALDLRRQGAELLLRSGRINDGLRVMIEVLDSVGVRLLRHPTHSALLTIARYLRSQISLRRLRWGGGRRAMLPGQIDPITAARADACWSAAIGLSLVEPLRAWDVQTRFLRYALASGDPARIARAVALEGCFTASQGRRVAAHSLDLADLAESIARDTGDAHARLLAVATRALVAYHAGDFSAALAGSDRVADLARDECPTAIFEMASAQLFSLCSLFFLGEIADLSRRLPVLLDQARMRKDLYAEVTLSTGIPNIYWLASDEPERAAEIARTAMEPWQGRNIRLQHEWVVVSDTQLLLYVGDGEAAWRRVSETMSKQSFLLRMPSVEIFMDWLRGRAAMAAAQCSGRPAWLLEEASRYARSIVAGRVETLTPWSHLLDAGVANLRGERDHARSLLRTAIARFDRSHMRLLAAVARRRLGELTTGEESMRLIEEADRFMTSQGIRNPPRMAAMFAPGF